MPDDPGPIKKIGSSTFAICLALLADGSAVFVVIASPTLQAWAKINSGSLVALSAILLATTLVAINQLVRSRNAEQVIVRKLELTRREHEKQLKDLESARSESDRKREQDRYRYENFLAEFGPETSLYQWIFERFHVTSADRPDLTKLDRACRNFTEDALYYHDANIELLHSSLVSSLESLRDSTIMHYFSVNGHLDKFVLEAQTSEAYDEAALKIERQSMEVVQAWRALARAAHESGLDIRC